MIPALRTLTGSGWVGMRNEKWKMKNSILRDVQDDSVKSDKSKNVKTLVLLRALAS